MPDAALNHFRHAEEEGLEPVIKGFHEAEALDELRGWKVVATLINTCVVTISAQFLKILRLETEPEPGRPLTAYGLDSLSAVELRNWIRVKIEVELTTLDITTAGSLIALCEKVVAKLPQVGSKDE
ncbi:MAG: hypothetical protein Q9166_008035 [cf. Caloplaca sp. 2 TL-2023]